MTLIRNTPIGELQKEFVEGQRRLTLLHKLIPVITKAEQQLKEIRASLECLFKDKLPALKKHQRISHEILLLLEGNPLTTGAIINVLAERHIQIHTSKLRTSVYSSLWNLKKRGLIYKNKNNKFHPWFLSKYKSAISWSKI